MKTVTAKEWDGVRAAWLWVETGIGSLLPVRYIDADWWIVTGRGVSSSSWCCRPDTRLYVGTREEAAGQELVLRDDLARRMKTWRAATPSFSERDCGGVFDGNQVISDADPGL